MYALHHEHLNAERKAFSSTQHMGLPGLRYERCPFADMVRLLAEIRRVESFSYDISNGFEWLSASAIMFRTRMFQLTKFGAASGFPVSAS